MDVNGDKLLLSSDEMRDTGFPGELEISYQMLMSVRCSIANGARVIEGMQSAADELSHTAMGRINEEARRQALRSSVASEIANQLNIRDTLDQIAGLPTTAEPPIRQ